MQTGQLFFLLFLSSSCDKTLTHGINCAHCGAISGGGSGRAGSDVAEGFEGEDDAAAAGGTDVQEAETGTR